MTVVQLSGFDRFTSSFAPKWTLNRLRARAAIDVIARHYEAAQPGRRTDGWHRPAGDADVALRSALLQLRWNARDLMRNNAWARRGRQIIGNHVVGTGIVPKAVSDNASAAKAAQDLWRAWAKTTECESEGRHTFAMIQSLCMRSIVESGEFLLRRRWRRPSDQLTVPFQIQVMESDYLDQAKNFLATPTNGPTIQGVQFDLLGRRTGYWLYEQHPGSGRNYTPSKLIPASEVIHVYYTERPGQTRAVSWLTPVIFPIKDFDGYEDATLMRQKIASCMAAFITETDGIDALLGVPSADPDQPETQTLEPGMIEKLRPGQDIKFANPPTVTDESFTTRTLRRIATGLGVTYEDLSGDYSQVTFSSARMARIEHWQNVDEWRAMLVALLCDGVWGWMVEAAQTAGELPKDVQVLADWSSPPMPMIEPDKEGLAIQRLVRTGAMTYSQMVREQGGDPEAHWEEYAADQKKLDALKIRLDSDVRAVSQAGLTQERVGLAGGKPPVAQEEQ